MTSAIFLYIYYAFLIGWFLIAFVALYHILSFGMKGLTTFFATILFVSVSYMILSASFYYIDQTDWTIPIFRSVNFNLDLNSKSF